MVTWEIVKKLAPWILATLVIGTLISATLRQCDDQLRAVSKQLENDRNLFMTGDKK